MRPHAIACALLWSACGNVVVSFPGDGGGSRACSATEACASPLVCNASGECVECVTDAQCAGPTPACDATVGRCVGCRGAIGCSAPTICSPTRPVCLQTCQDNPDCPGFVDGCRMNVCSACNEDDDCGAARYCDSPVGRCVSCLVDEHCAAPTPRCDVSSGTCRACATNADCAAGAACFQGTCRAAH